MVNIAQWTWSYLPYVQLHTNYGGGLAPFLCLHTWGCLLSFPQARRLHVATWQWVYNNVFTKDKSAVLKVSFLQRFHCTHSQLGNHGHPYKWYKFLTNQILHFALIRYVNQAWQIAVIWLVRNYIGCWTKHSIVYAISPNLAQVLGDRLNLPFDPKGVVVLLEPYAKNGAHRAKAQDRPTSTA